MGSSGQNSTPSFYARLANATLGTKFRIVVGYKSAVDVNQAVETGETQAASTTWSDLSTHRAAWLRDQGMRFIRAGLQTYQNWTMAPPRPVAWS
mgnify:CR=1 FL=1